MVTAKVFLVCECGENAQITSLNLTVVCPNCDRHFQVGKDGKVRMLHLCNCSSCNIKYEDQAI